jgi:uncharacterized protein YfaP (DUF2135 family)
MKIGEEIMKYCPNCKVEFLDERKFCTECGTKLEIKKPVEKPTKKQPEKEVLEETMPQMLPPPKEKIIKKPASTFKPKSKFKIVIGAVAIILILIVAAVFFGFMPGMKQGGGGVKSQYINSGENIPVTSQSVTFTGGTISVTDSLSPLYGLNIDVPQAAASDGVEFSIGYADVTSVSGLPEGTSVASKMINIETDGTYIWNEYKAFEKPCTVTLPYDPSIVTNEESVRFYSYDAVNNLLDSTGFISQDTSSNTITFYAGTFSSFIAIELSMAIHELLGSDYSVDTGFRPATDGWFIDNYGSYLESGGICLGMMSYAKWYYAHKKATDGGLYSKYLEGDPDEWRDDETAIQLATRAHMGSSGIWSSLTQEEKDWATTNSADVAYSIIHGMIVSGQPQLIGLKTRRNDGSWAEGGHAVLAYQYTGGRFDICDPNYHGTAPGTDVRQIPFTYGEGFTRVYSSGQTAGEGRQYNVFYHASSKTFSPENAYSQLYDAAEKNFEDDTIFPTVTLTSPDTPTDTDYDGIRDTKESKVTISGTITGGQKDVTSTLIFVSNQKFTVPVVGGSFSQEVPLFAGENDLIILATDENTRSNWAGYLRDTIESTASVASLTFTLTWGQDASDVDLHVLEPTLSGTEGRHIYYSNLGYEGSGNPYLDIDDRWGYGPEHYYATEDMTLPNYVGLGKSLYGTYKFRVHYYADHDSDYETTQAATWQVSVRYLAFKDVATGTEYWEENSWNGILTAESTYGTGEFYNSGASWSTIYEVEYLQPDPDDYGVPPPPQNELP